VRPLRWVQEPNFEKINSIFQNIMDVQIQRLRGDGLCSSFQYKRNRLKAANPREISSCVQPCLLISKLECLHSYHVLSAVRSYPLKSWRAVLRALRAIVAFPEKHSAISDSLCDSIAIRMGPMARVK
jgi:hypothetical protein